MCNNYKFGQWYPVTDIQNEMPREFDWVMISYVDDTDNRLRFVPSIGELRNGRWVTQESEVDSINRKDKIDFEKDYLVKVTHWMPLPDPPRD